MDFAQSGGHSEIDRCATASSGLPTYSAERFGQTHPRKMRAFEVSAVDYLVKPLHEARFRDTFVKVRERLRSNEAIELSRRLSELLAAGNQYLELELTESLLLTNQDVMLSVVQQLKELGVSLAIDDFGTGYSSLSYLTQFRVNKLKIDRLFARSRQTPTTPPLQRQSSVWRRV